VKRIIFLSLTLTTDLYVIFKTNSELKNIQDLFLSNYDKIGSESTTCDKTRGYKSRKSAYNEQSVSVENVLAMEFRTESCLQVYLPCSRYGLQLETMCCKVSD